MLPFIQTDQGLNLILGGKIRTVSEQDPKYQELLAAVIRGADAAEVTAIIERELNRVSKAVNALIEKNITDDVKISGGLVLFRGEEVNNTLADRMLKMLDEGFGLIPMARFLANLMENPSYRAVRDLYSFLEHGKMPITEDGCFLAYKAVNPDYTDIYTSSISNAIGEKPWMPRNKVDENPDRTCSNGYHVCSFDYLPRFAHNNGHVMICKVNPRDVVAIPRDYHNTKMRINTYEVFREYEGYYTAKRENVLTATTVATEEEPFLVIVTGTDPSTERFARLSIAAEMAEAALDDPSTERVVLKNGITDTVISTFENPNFEGYEDDDSEDDDDFEDEEDDEEEREEEETDPTFEIVYGDDVESLKDGGGTVFDSGIDGLLDAKDRALNAVDELPGKVVQVREEDSGDVKLTLS